MFSATVSQGKSAYSWKTTPRSTPGAVTGRPATSTQRPRRAQEPAEDVEQRALAAARRPDDRDELALVDHEIDAGEGENPAFA